jgi:hypothetical protein
MKFFQYLVPVLFVFTSCQAQDKSKTIRTTGTINKIEVIDFHTTRRCKTCLKIEDNTKNLLQSDFKQEMDSGTLSFYTVNIDDKANFEIAERFEAAGTALFINVVKDGIEQHIDLTDFAFMKAFDEDEFAAELKAIIDQQLKSL